MLGRALAMECPGYIGSSSWRQLSALPPTFRRMWGGAIPASAYKQDIGVAFKQLVIIIHGIIESDVNIPSTFGTAPRRTGKFSCRKAKRQCGCPYGSWMSSPSGVS